jgi:penicillin-binding protein 2
VSILETPLTHERRPARFVAFALTAVLVLGGLTTRLFAMQLAGSPPSAPVPAAVLPVVEAGRQVVTEPVPSTRGLIYDRSNGLLVENVPTFTVLVRPADLPLTQQPQVVLRLAGLLGIPATTITETLDGATGSRFDPVPIAHDVPEQTARLISEDSLTLPGVEVAVEARRDYLDGPLFTQLIGWTGSIDAAGYASLKSQGYLPDDRIGKAGVESVYESTLRGTYGVREVEKDGTGRTLRVLSTTTAPQAGNSLVLTIDTKEQRLAQQALDWGLKLAGVRRGAIVVMNPQTGEILAMVSEPTYDANLFSRGISTADFQKLLADKDLPLINHAIGDIQPPGSTYKLVTGSGVLADKKLGLTETVLSKPYVQVGSTPFWEWNRRGWGPLNIKAGFAHSSDTFFYQLAQRLGIDRLAYWAGQYGFGQKSGIDLPGESAGLVPTNQWKLDTFGQTIFPGEVLQAGIGQGYDLATPLQLLNAYAALANGGTLYQPQVVREIVSPDGTVVRPFTPKVIRKIAAPSWVFTTMREAARQVVTSRHTYNLADLPIVVAGKTGTAEFGLRDKNGVLPYHNWFAGFIPKNAWKKDNPTGDVSRPDSQLAFAVFIYNAGTLGNAATEVAKYYLQLHYGITKDYRLPQLLKHTNFYTGGR